MFRAILKKYWKLLLSILLVSALGCAMMTGLTSGYLSLEWSLTHYVRDYAYPDAVIQTAVTTRDQADRLRSLPGISEVNPRLIGDTIMKSPAGRYLSVRGKSYSDEDFQQFYYWDRIDPGEAEAVLLEYVFAVENGISAGDTISVRIGDTYRDYLVEGTVSMPETLVMQPTQAAWGDNSDFGYLYFPDRLLELEDNPDYENAKQELEEKAGELEEAETDAREEYETALSELQKAQDALDEKRKELAEGKESAKDQQAALDSAQTELKEKQKELDSFRKSLRDQETELAQADALLREKQAELNAGIAQAEAQQAQLDDAADRIARGEQELEAAYALLSEKQAEVTAAEQELTEKRQDTESKLALLFRVQTFLETLRRIIGGETDCCSLCSRLRERVREALQELPPDSVFAKARSVLEQLKQDFDQEQLELDSDPETEKELREDPDCVLKKLKERVLAAIGFAEECIAALIDEAQAGIAQIDAGFAALTEAREQIAQGYAQAEEKAAELEAGRQAYAQGQSQIAAAWQEIESGKQQLAAGYAQSEQFHAELLSYRNQLDMYQSEIDRGDKELKEAQNEFETALSDALSEGEKRIGEGQKELDRKSEEADTAWQEALTEFADLEEELRAARDELGEWEGYQEFCNQFLLRFTPDANRQETLEEAVRILEEEAPEVQDSFLYEDSRVKELIDSNLIPIKTLAVTMPIIFFTIVLIVGFLFMSLIVRQSRREIGILRALGFRAGDIRFLFCTVNLPVSLGAVLLGTLIGFFLSRFIGGSFQHSFPLPVYEYVTDVGNAVLSALLTVAAGQAATLFGSTVISRIQPSEAMSRQTPSSVKLSGSVRWLTRKASPFVKFSILSLLRNKKRFVFSVICLSASVMMILSSFTFLTSKNTILTKLFGQRLQYDCQVFLSEKPDASFLNSLSALDYVSEITPIGYYVSELSFHGPSETVSLIALPEDSDMIRVYGEDNAPCAIPPEGILLDKHLAEELGAVPGDLVLVDGTRLQVAGLSDQDMYRSQFISTRQAKELGEAPLHSILIRTDCTDPAAQEEGELSLLSLLSERKDYLYCIFTRIYQEGLEDTFALFDIAAWIVIAFSVLIGLVIVVNTSQTNLLEQKKEICLLRTLGFSHRQVSGNLFLQSVLHFAFSCVIGLPCGVWVAKILLDGLETKLREYPFANGFAEYLLTAGMVFGFVLLSHLICAHAVRKWDIVDTVKEKE